MSAVILASGTDDPLVLESRAGADMSEYRGPPGVVGEQAARVVAESLASAIHGPPLAAHLVDGDRLVVAVSGGVPQGAAVLEAVREVLGRAGRRLGGLSVLEADLRSDVAAAAPAGDPGEPEHRIAASVTGQPAADPPGRCGPAGESPLAYLAADDLGRPLYLSRPLVDADVVLAVGAFSWNASLASRSLDGELWPAFSTPEERQKLVLSLARRGRRGLPPWRAEARRVLWQLGVCASLRLLSGSGGTLHGACFGPPAETVRRARAAADGWRPRVAAAADLVVASLADASAGFESLTRAVAAAARVTRPDGTICVVGRVGTRPGIVFLRWREGAPLVPLLREAVGSGDAILAADALATRLFARALGSRRLVLLSDLDATTVEELEFSHAESPEAVERLVYRADRVVVLHEADRMLPRLDPPAARGHNARGRKNPRSEPK